MTRLVVQLEVSLPDEDRRDAPEIGRTVEWLIEHGAVNSPPSVWDHCRAEVVFIDSPDDPDRPVGADDPPRPCGECGRLVSYDYEAEDWRHEDGPACGLALSAIEEAEDYLDRKIRVWSGQYGEVIAVDTDPARKPLIVRHIDGSIGYYHLGQVSLDAAS
jgi:hypothetical protein